MPLGKEPARCAPGFPAENATYSLDMSIYIVKMTADSAGHLPHQSRHVQWNQRDSAICASINGHDVRRAGGTQPFAVLHLYDGEAFIS